MRDLAMLGIISNIMLIHNLRIVKAVFGSEMHLWAGPRELGEESDRAGSRELGEKSDRALRIHHSDEE